MKKFLLATSAVILGLSLTGNAMADCNGLYLGVRGGITRHDYSKKDSGPKLDMKKLDKNTLMLSGALGWRYDYWRTELEYVWRDKADHTVHSSGGGHSNLTFNTQSFMWNNYIDFAPYHWISPYAGVGLGFTKMKYTSKTHTDFGEVIDNTDGWNNKPTKFTWSLGGGLTVKVTNRFNVDAGYRYYDMGSIRHMDVTAHEVYGGVRYVF